MGLQLIEEEKKNTHNTGYVQIQIKMTSKLFPVSRFSAMIHGVLESKENLTLI